LASEGHGFRDPQEEAQALGQRERPRQGPVEPVSLHPFHRVEGPPVGERTHVVDRNDPGMLESCQHLSFAAQAGLDAGVRHVDHLERDPPLELGIFHDVDGAHAAGASDAGEAVLRPREIRLAHRRAQP